MKRNEEEIIDLMMGVSKRLKAIKDAEIDYPLQSTLRGLVCFLIETIADAEGKSIEDVLEDIERYMTLCEGGKRDDR